MSSLESKNRSKTMASDTPSSAPSDSSTPPFGTHSSASFSSATISSANNASSTGSNNTSSSVASDVNAGTDWFDSIDLEWLAFQYLADELSESSRTAFELLMATDLAACEALARAVSLWEAIAHSPEIRVTDPAREYAARECTTSGSTASNYSTGQRVSAILPVSEPQVASGSGFSAAAVSVSSGQGTGSRGRTVRSGQQRTFYSVLQRAVVLAGTAACLALMVRWAGPASTKPGRIELSRSVGLAALWVQVADAVNDGSLNDLNLNDQNTAQLRDESDFAVSSNETASGIRSSKGNLTDSTGDTLTDPAELESDLEVASSANVSTNAEIPTTRVRDSVFSTTFDDDEIPGWMLAAVAEQQREMGSDPEDEVIQD